MLSSQFRQATGFFFLLLFLFYFSPLFAKPSVATYEQLVEAIRAAHHASEARVEQTVEAEKVREAWETGHLIQVHILLNQDRAKYGEKVIARLAADLGMNKRELQYMVEFAKSYSIVPSPSQLSWSHYKALLGVNDPAERQVFEKKAQKEKWPSNLLRKVIPKRKPKTTEAEPEPGKLAELSLGKIGKYQIVKIHDSLKVDLGFEFYHSIPEKYEGELKKGSYVVAKNSFFAESLSAKPADLFTYAAVLIDVVDGDTFHAVIDLGFESQTIQRLRLRRIDAPEIISADGKKAKKLLEKILNRSNGGIKLKISKSNDQDQYGRYLVDIWVLDKQIDQELVDSELFTIREGNLTND